MNSHPVSLQLYFGALLVIAVFVFIVGALMIRRLRREMLHGAKEAPVRLGDSNAAPAPGTGISLAAYHAVIQQMKTQEQELDRLHRSERDRAQATENLSEAVLANLASGVVLFNPAGLVQQANQAARDILGYASPTGLHARDLFRGVTAVRMPAADSAAIVPPSLLPQMLESALREGRATRRIEADFATPTAQQRVLGITISPVRGGSGAMLGAACLISDLTEITRLSQQVRLRENLAALGEMSAGIAHEFKNSLATISGYAQMLQKETDPANTRKYAAKIASQTMALARVVSDFLSFARPQGLQKEPIPLRSLLAECAEGSRVQLDASAVPADLQISGDRLALHHAFSNLMRNSAEASTGRGQPPSGPAVPAVHITAAARLETATVRLLLSDDAGGISAEALPKLFIPFFTTKPEGTGLGLALVQRILAEHGGSISAANGPRGAVFTISLPAINSAGDAPQRSKM